MFRHDATLLLLSGTGQHIGSVDVELASTEQEHARGLMHRTFLGDHQGMLFVFAEESSRSFWMRDTSLSLDMFFADSARTITTIHRMTVPYSSVQYSSEGPSRFVLEMKAGATARLGIKPGDRFDLASMAGKGFLS